MELFNIHHIGARKGTIGFPKLNPFTIQFHVHHMMLMKNIVLK